MNVYGQLEPLLIEGMKRSVGLTIHLNLADEIIPKIGNAPVDSPDMSCCLSGENVLPTLPL